MQMAYAWWPEPGRRSSCATCSAAAARTPFAIWRCRPQAARCRASRRSARCSAGTSARSPTCSVSNSSAIPSPTGWCCARARSRSLPPFDPDYPPDAPVPVDQNRRFIPEIAGAVADVQELPFGPIRADVVEFGRVPVLSTSARRSCIYQPRLFFKHRGMEKRFEGLLPRPAWCWPSASPGVGSLAHALAYCQAVEAASGCAVPPRARSLAGAAGRAGAALQPPALPRPSGAHDDAQGRRGRGQAARGAAEADERAADRQPVSAQPADPGRAAPRSRPAGLARRRARDAAPRDRRLCRPCSRTPTAISTG